MGATGSVARGCDERAYTRAHEKTMLNEYNATAPSTRRVSANSRLSTAKRTPCVLRMAVCLQDTSIFRLEEHVTDLAEYVAQLPLNTYVDRRRAEWARVRENVLMQIYNSSYPKDLGYSLKTLRESLQRCSIQKTGWSAVQDISAALSRAGVSSDDSAILLLLANRASKSDGLLGSGGRNRCVYSRFIFWPNIINFLEEGASTPVKADCASQSDKHPGRGRDNPDCQSARGKGIGGDNHATTQNLDNRDTLPTDDGASLPHRSPVLNGKATAATIESYKGVPPAVDDDLTAVAKYECSGEYTSIARDRLEQGLVELEDNLRVTVSARTVQVSEIIKKVREVLRAATVECEVHAGKREGEATVDTPLGMVECELGCVGSNTEVPNQEDEGMTAVPGDDESTSPSRHFGDENPIAAACAARKRGDVDALQNLARVMDLRGKDAFGRNALYYACLCGHVAAAHFVVVWAYGGVKKIPEEERWECRKNALTEEVRRYFDTGGLNQRVAGTLSSLDTNQWRPPARPKTASVDDLQALGNRNKEAGDTKAIGIGEHPAPQEDVVSIATLFGWGYGGNNVDDY